MLIRNLFYLLQLEEYDLKRFNEWLKKNPGRIVEEKKKKIVWTAKARLVFKLASFLNFLTFKKIPALSLKMAIYILAPIDWLIKKTIIMRAQRRIKKMKNLIAIGITGSYGKTTTRDAIAHILEQKFPGKILKTEENYNTPLGVAKTILGKLKPDYQIFVCEMGAYQRGDIKKITNLVKPKIGIITAVNEMHLERFGSLKNILKTKMELIEALPADGAGFLNQEIKPLWEKFSFTPKTKAKIDYFTNIEDLFEKIGAIFEIKKEMAIDYLKTLPATAHRCQITKVSGDITIIDDTYNSNPRGFAKALEIMQKIWQENNTKNDTMGKKILITPGMIELGEKQFEFNKIAAKQAAEITDFIIVVGETNRKAITAGLKEKIAPADCQKKILEVKNLTQAQMILTSLAKPGSVVLLENDLPDHYF